MKQKEPLCPTTVRKSVYEILVKIKEENDLRSVNAVVKHLLKESPKYRHLLHTMSRTGDYDDN